MDINPHDLHIDVFRNPGETQVHITHRPTGAVGIGHDPDRPVDSMAARDLAMADLAAKLGVCQPTPEEIRAAFPAPLM